MLLALGPVVDSEDGATGRANSRVKHVLSRVVVGHIQAGHTLFLSLLLEPLRTSVRRHSGEALEYVGQWGVVVI